MTTIILVLLIIGAFFLADRLFASHDQPSRRSSPAPRPDGSQPGPDLAATQWTELDDLQLNRLLDEYSP